MANTSTDAGQRALIERLRDLLAKVDSPNGHDWTFPLRVVPSDGKPIIASSRGGSLFRGYIATWQEADLIVETLNALPEILAAFASPVTPAAATIPEGKWFGGVAFHDTGGRTFAQWGLFGRKWWPRRLEFPQGMGGIPPAELEASPVPPATIPGGDREVKAIAFLASRLTEIQREAIAKSVFLAGSWGLSDWNEDHPDIEDHLSEDIANSVSGELTPLGLALHAALTSTGEASDEVLADAGGARDRLKDAAESVIDNAQRSYRKRGKDRYIEDSNGELMMLVPHEDWFRLGKALEALAAHAAPAPEAEEKA